MNIFLLLFHALVFVPLEASIYYCIIFGLEMVINQDLGFEKYLLKFYLRALLSITRGVYEFSRFITLMSPTKTRAHACLIL